MEVERVTDPEAPQSPSWEECKSEWVMGHHEEIKGKLRQARAAAAVRTFYGGRSMESFAKDVGAEKTKVYDYARMWKRLLSAFETEQRISERLENAPLKVAQIIEATRGPIPEIPATLDRMEDENISGRQAERERKEKSVPTNVEVVTEFVCPHCGGVSNMSAVETREVPAS